MIIEINKHLIDKIILKLENHQFVNNLRLSSNALKNLHIYDVSSDFSLFNVIKG